MIINFLGFILIHKDKSIIFLIYVYCLEIFSLTVNEIDLAPGKLNTIEFLRDISVSLKGRTRQTTLILSPILEQNKIDNLDGRNEEKTLFSLLLFLLLSPAIIFVFKIFPFYISLNIKTNH